MPTRRTGLAVVLQQRAVRMLPRRPERQEIHAASFDTPGSAGMVTAKLAFWKAAIGLSKGPTMSQMGSDSVIRLCRLNVRIIPRKRHRPPMRVSPRWVRGSNRSNS
jgi:hypothetical protein